jgi:ketosteroid isomerase-like protein
MNRWLVRLAPLALLASQFGCTQAPPPAPPDTRAADEKAIRDMEAGWGKEFTSKNMDKVLAHYADDAAVMMPNMALQTTASARTMFKGLMDDPRFSLDIRTAKVEVSKGGDLAYSQGTYTMVTTGPKKKPVTEMGKYVEVYKKQADGSWKVINDINNADAPAR